MSIAQNFPQIRPSLSLDFANVKALDPRITFARASSATYYGTQTAKAEENLLLRSQEFNVSPWNVARGSITANATIAPDGTLTAEKLAYTSGTNEMVAFQAGPVFSGVVTLSCFLKAGELTFAIIRTNNSALKTWFNLATGAVGTSSVGHTANIEDYGNGWYRCSVTFTQTATQMDVGGAETDGGAEPSTAGDGVFLWGAQLEQRSSVTAYTPTTTQPITNYIPVLQTASANVARFDHNPVTGESLGLLVEEQRTNLLTYSEQFDNAAWTKTRSSITANTIVAPDGTLTGDKLVEDTTASNSHTLLQNVTINNATVYSFSFYAKAAERSLIRVNSPSIGVDLWFNLATGLLQITTLGTGTITPVGNGWYRIVATGTSNTTSGAATIFLSNGTTHIYTGDGYSGIYIWGAQLEAGAFPTSYIPTVASQVTRSRDDATMTGANFSDWYRQDEGTVYCEASKPASSVPFVLSFNDNTQLNRLELLYVTATNLRLRGIANNVNDVNITKVTGDSGFVKAAGVFKFNDFAFTESGETAGVDTSGVLPSFTQLNIASSSSNTVQLNGHIRKLAFYPSRLSNENLVALTS
jgi:hypothetical protein